MSFLFTAFLLFSTYGRGDMLSDIIKKNAEKYDVSPSIVAAIICQESQGEVWAFRWEPFFYRKYLELRPRAAMSGFVPAGLPSLEDEKRARAASYGAMQILGETARGLGFQGRYLLQILDPEINIELGTRYFAMMLKDAKAKKLSGDEAIKHALLRYNGGGNKDYPRLVLRHLTNGNIEKMVDAK